MGSVQLRIDSVAFFVHCMHRAATRLLRRPIVLRPVAQTPKRAFQLGASTLFAASATASAANTTNTTVPLSENTSNSQISKMNGSAENVAGLVNGQSKKMHSKVVGCGNPRLLSFYVADKLCNMIYRRLSSVLVPLATLPLSTSPERILSLLCLKACWQTALRPEASLQRQRMSRTYALCLNIH